MKLLTIDFETYDPYIKRKLGAGWVYKLNVPNSDFKVLGASAITHEDKVLWVTSKKQLKELLDSHDACIMHNASYDLGCITSLGIDVKDYPVYDTEVMARLFNSNFQSYSLSALGKLLLNNDKDDGGLGDGVWEAGIYPWLKKELNAKAKAERNGEVYERVRPPMPKLIKFAKENMGLLYETNKEALIKYAHKDTELTKHIYLKLKDYVDLDITRKYSMLAHVCNSYRERGVRIDLNAAREAKDELIKDSVQAHREVYKIADEEFNINSIKDVPRIFDKLSIPYPRTPAGNPSVTTPWMAGQDHPICVAISKARRIDKINRDCITKMIEIQEYTCPDATDVGMIYPSLNLLRARTGRFSCEGPNIQQIPGRDPRYSEMCRKLFLAPEGSRLFSLDYSNQEGRLQIHYASKLNCDGADELVLGFKANPNLDMHQKIADLVGIDRHTAKTINLGLSYGMGNRKLAKQLTLSETQASQLRDKYNLLAPFLNSLSRKCKKALASRKFIKTLGGRRLRLPEPQLVNGRERTFEYKGLNMLIQGSAADQIIEAMVLAYQKGINVLFPIHDQIVMSGTAEQAALMHDIMVNCFELEVPVVVDYNKDGGLTWAEAGH